MAFVSFTAHNFTAAGRSKALCGCFASFEFWHGLVLFGHKLIPYHVFATFCKGDLGRYIRMVDRSALGCVDGRT